MSRYETEEEQIVAIKEWWNKNSKQLISSILVVSLAWLGWNYYQQDKKVKAQRASTIFSVMSTSLEQGSFGEIAREGIKLVQEQPKSPYSVGVSLLLAKYHLQQNKTDEAIQNLQWVVKNSTDAPLALVAKLRLVNLFIDLDKMDEADKILTSINENKLSSTEKARFSYAKAMVELKNSNTDTAVTLLNKVVVNKKATASLISLSQLQLDDLAK
jgi:predicted negative regulator of RcsB-dependent stress response